MASTFRWAARYAPALLALLLPVILVYSSLRTFQELEQMRQVFLRDRSAAITARLETMPGSGPERIRILLEEEPGLIGLAILDRAASDPSTRLLWTGGELFRTELVRVNGRTLFRALTPFHEAGELRIARVDLDEASADFLLLHARHNVVIASVSSAALLLLTGFALWSVHRHALQEKKRLELTHLAHLGKLSAVLAHEIRNPLGTIKGFTQLALEHGDARTRSVLEPVLRESVRLERLVGDLLLYGRPPQPVLTACTWQELTGELKGFADVPVDIAPSPVRFRTDPNLLRQVLSNLIRNSCEALSGQPGGCVQVSAAVRGDDLAIRVDDNGPGIPEEQREKVFESFYTTKSFGTGLGLPIARSLTAGLGGTFALLPRPAGGIRAEVRLTGAVLHERAAEVRV